MPAMPPADKHFVLVTRSWCHLCDEMRAALEAFRDQLEIERSFTFELQDVDADENLLALYDEAVPALLWQGRLVCKWHFDPQALQQALA
jgi:glutaredoxin